MRKTNQMLDISLHDNTCRSSLFRNSVCQTCCHLHSGKFRSKGKWDQKHKFYTEIDRVLFRATSSKLITDCIR